MKASHAPSLFREVAVYGIDGRKRHGSAQDETRTYPAAELSHELFVFVFREHLFLHLEAGRCGKFGDVFVSPSSVLPHLFTGSGRAHRPEVFDIRRVFRIHKIRVAGALSIDRHDGSHSVERLPRMWKTCSLFPCVQGPQRETPLEPMLPPLLRTLCSASSGSPRYSSVWPQSR